ncbi:glucosaminidase domain-containing protein [Tenacibaculum xiamenense]|uniref:glucosaminidase domain-containing protein n=1 Tax=Tenacibaculum xiamenense TaxID=1261553 RepID=UPI003893CE52
MKFKLSVAIILASLLLSSCGSKKKVVTSNRKVVLEEKEEMPEIPQLEQIKKTSITTPKNTNEYILKFAPIAVKKMHEHNIPASITLAQGILESGSGRSPLAVRSNNHFGIKCHRGWKGKSVTHDDDEKGECFRKYKYPESSYEDHSQFLLTRKRYASLFRLRHTDYKGWAYGLKRAGYATDRRYPQKLISLIHKYDLMKYDRIRPSKKRQKTIGNYYEVKKGDTLYSIARRHNISVKLLKEINGLRSNQISIGQHLLVQ